MINDKFRVNYTTVPVAMYKGKHTKITETGNTVTLAHAHRELEIIWITRGEAIFTVENKPYHVRKDDVIAVSPYAVHSCTVLAGKEFCHFCICFDLKLIYDRTLTDELENGTAGITPFISGDIETTKHLAECIKNACALMDERQPGWELETAGNLSVFMGLLKRNNYIYKAVENQRNKLFCASVMNYIDSNYSYDIGASDIANKLYMNESYFCRVFKKNFGYTFHKYLSIYRAEKAKLLLNSTDMSVSEAAALSGFNNLSYFGKIFKGIYGLSATEYRNSTV